MLVHVARLHRPVAQARQAHGLLVVRREVGVLYVGAQALQRADLAAQEGVAELLEVRLERRVGVHERGGDDAPDVLGKWR